MISVKALQKNYGSFPALKDISFDVSSGEVLGLLGPNGAGKTTTMRILTGFLGASAGTVLVDGHAVADQPEVVQALIGYLPEQAPLYPDLSVHEHLDFAAEVHGITGAKKEKAIRTACEQTGLTERLYFAISELSKGYRQRVGLAQALIHDPKILILDEPTTGLDPNQILEIRELITELGEKKTVILSTHIMQEVEAVCDRVIVINEGKIVAEGAPGDLAADTQRATHQYRVTVQGAVGAVTEFLKKIKGVERVEKIPGSPRGTATALVYASSDIRTVLTKKLASSFDLLELSTEKASMEDVFASLTK